MPRSRKEDFERSSSRTELVPAGKYQAEILAARHRNLEGVPYIDKNGNPYIRGTVCILDAEYQDTRIHFNIFHYLTPHFCKVIGLAENYAYHPNIREHGNDPLSYDVEKLCDQLPGRRAIVKVKVRPETDKYPASNDIVDWFVWEEDGLPIKQPDIRTSDTELEYISLSDSEEDEFINAQEEI